MNNKERNIIYIALFINTTVLILFRHLKNLMNFKVYLGLLFVFIIAYVVLFRILWISYKNEKKYELLNFDFNNDIKNQLPNLDEDKIKDFLGKVSKYNYLREEDFIRIIVENKQVYIEDYNTEHKEVLDYRHIEMIDKWFESEA